MTHFFGRFEDSQLRPALEAYSEGYMQAVLIDHTFGSVHTGTHICELAPGGILQPHKHAFEESFYILQGAGSLRIDDHVYALVAGDLGVAKVGQTHAWQNTGSEPLRWFQMAAPQPKPAGGWQDTFFLDLVPDFNNPVSLQAGDTPHHILSHFAIEDIPPPGDPAREGAGAPPGVYMRWLLDEHMGAVHHRLLFIEYQPGVSIDVHDHTFEESYLILDGTVDVILEDAEYTATPGSLIWTSVGSFHSFVNKSDQPVRWLETFSPQPPRENVFRFKRLWE